MIIQSSIHCCVCWFICRLFNDSKQELGWAELYTEYGKTTGWCPTFSDTQISSFMVTRSISKNESAGADSKKKRHWNWSRGLSCEVIVMSHYVPLKLPFVCFGHHVQTQPCSKQPPFSTSPITRLMRPKKRLTASSFRGPDVCPAAEPPDVITYHLVMTNIAMENHHF
jgi:hypothetical protein